jgi:hypothetical protein
VSITYANDIHTDGAGAQIHRILGTIALAEALKTPYNHSPIIKLDYHGWDLYLKNEVDAELPRKWETFLGFPEAETPQSKKIHVWDNVRPDDLSGISRWIRDGGQARILLPYPFLDIFSHYLESVRPRLLDWYDSTPKPSLKKTASFQVAVHVRRGELHLWESHRMLPNEYYLKIIRELKKHVPADTEFHIHSEGNISTDKGSEELANAERYSQYMKEKSKIVKKNRDHFDDFVQEGCILHINEDIFQTFHRCVTSDIFVMSKGSLSYVMGAYAKGMVFYQPFWHRPLPSWFVMPEWHSIGTIKDALIKGPGILKQKVIPDKKKWKKLQNATMLRMAQIQIKEPV